MNRKEVQEIINNLQDREAVEKTILERLGESEDAINIIDDISTYNWG